MKKSHSFFTKYKKILIVGLTIVLLTTLRIVWILLFTMSDAPHAVGGKLDLRNLELQAKETITLDGEWDFYPHTFLMDHDEIDINTDKDFLHVPSGWNNLISNDEETSFGYGSYRLRILVDPKIDTNYSIRIPSIRSSSELYVNGQLVAKSGQPANNKTDYIAKNIPYTATFSANGLKELDIIIHVANYKDTRKSGIIRSVSFGTEEAIKQSTSLSVLMQQIVSITFLLHALYAVILYFLGGREKRLLYFSLLIGSVTLLMSITNDDKIFLDLLQINYDWNFKLTHLMLVVTSFALLKSMADEFPAFYRTKIIPLFSLLCGIVVLLILFLPTEKIFTINILYFFIGYFSFLSTIIILLFKSVQIVKEHFFILIAILAVTNNFIWTDILRGMGIKTLYYPFDLVIAIIAFSMIWFNQYFQNYTKMQILTEKLQRTDQLKDQFLANTSHELRNPLHGIINISQAVIEREKKTLKKKSIQDLEGVVTVGRQMSYLLNDLLDVMHLKENNITIHKSAVNIHSTAAGIIQILQFMTEGKPIQIMNRIPKDFPPVHADENRLTQILFNLLHNAVKFTNEGTVYIIAEVKSGKAQISVHDTGIGMSEELITRVFEPYEQATYNEAAVEGGFGLGLNISQQLVKLHGSELTVQTTLGKGSVFTFALNIADSVYKQLDVTNVKQQHTSSEEIASTHQIDDVHPKFDKTKDARPRILAVDDDPFNLSVLKNILPTEDYDVVTVTSGKKALELINTEHWHLIISDIMMPNISGYELTQKVRERFSLLDLPIILLTALSNSKETERGFSVGANDFVTKPIDAIVLRSRVKALTDLQLSMTERLRMKSALLQAQIQPHFLFNTLNSIAALSKIDTDRMLRLLDEFSNYLRTSFDFHNLENLVPIEYELDLVRSYLYIEKERFPKRLTAHFEIDDEIQFLIPPLTIQPLVENAVKHGILKKQGGGTITVKVSEHDFYYQIRIEDDGAGICEELLERLRTSNYKSSQGIGLVNTHKRLKEAFGSGLKITSIFGEGTVVSFIIQKEKSLG